MSRLIAIFYTAFLFVSADRLYTPYAVLFLLALSIFGHCGLHDQVARLEARDHPHGAGIDRLAFRLRPSGVSVSFAARHFCRSCRISGSPLCVLPARVFAVFIYPVRRPSDLYRHDLVLLGDIRFGRPFQRPAEKI